MKINQFFVPTITLANVTMSLLLSKLMTASAGLNNYDTFRLNGNYYQVPVGKKLIIRAMRSSSDSTAGNGIPKIGYGDTAVSNTSAIPTNYVPFDLGGLYDFQSVWSQSNDKQEVPLYVEVPAGKYPCIQSASGGSGAIAQFLCEEVSV